MLPFKKILAPTDFSEPSLEGIKAANEIAVHFGAQLCLIHVVSPVPTAAYMTAPEGPPLPPVFNVTEYQRELANTARKSLQEVVDRFVSRELRTRQVITEGDEADEIVKTAAQERSDLIVIATHGRTGWRRFIFGSVTEKVVRTASCPALTVPVPHQEE